MSSSAALTSAAASGQQHQNVLGFDTAMAQFTAMFPEVSAGDIEAVLRKHAGDVSSTIDELLRRGSGGPRGGSEGTTNDAEDDIRKQKEGQKQQRVQCSEEQPQKQRDNAAASASARDPCADDEKIALLIQNREFLRYLRHDPRFQRELLGGQSPHRQRRHHHHNHHGRNFGGRLPSGPVLLTSSRPAQSPNSRRLFRQHTAEFDGSTTAQRIPEGPPVEFRSAKRELAIPEGPLIDYVDSENRESGWAQRLKAKLTSSASERRPGSIASGHANEQLPPSPLVHYSDDQLRGRIHRMDKDGQGLLLGLARKFSQLGRPNRAHLQQDMTTSRTTIYPSPESTDDTREH